MSLQVKRLATYRVCDNLNDTDFLSLSIHHNLLLSLTLKSLNGYCYIFNYVICYCKHNKHIYSPRMIAERKEEKNMSNVKEEAMLAYYRPLQHFLRYSCNSVL